MAALHRDDASVITAEPHAVAVQAQPYGYAGAPVHPHNNNYETGSVAAPPPSSDPFAPQAAMQTWKNAHVASPSAPVSFPQVAAAYPPPYSMVAGEGSATGLVVTQPPPLRFVTGMSQPMLPGADTSPDTQPVLEHKPGEYTSHGSEQNATAGRARVKRGCCAPCCAPCDRCLAKDFEHSLGSCFALDALVSTLCCLWCQWTATRVKVRRECKRSAWKKEETARGKNLKSERKGGKRGMRHEAHRQNQNRQTERQTVKDGNNKKPRELFERDLMRARGRWVT